MVDGAVPQLLSADGIMHMQDLVRPLVEDESQKKERRKLDKFITLNVQQISGTQQQVVLSTSHHTAVLILACTSY